MHFFVHLAKICCILGWTRGELIFLLRLVKWVWVLRTYLIQAVKPLLLNLEESDLPLKAYLVPELLYPSGVSVQEIVMSRIPKPKVILQGSYKDILKFNNRQKFPLAWRSHRSYPGVQRSPQHQRNDKNSQACNKGHPFLTSVKQ